MNKPGDLKVWWIPQVPMKSFEVPVKDVYEGVKLMSVLAAYDDFQYKNRIKPDYSNAGGIQIFDEDAGEGIPGWVDWYLDNDGEYYDDPEEYVVDHPNG
jgi:hypothetical protein